MYINPIVDSNPDVMSDLKEVEKDILENDFNDTNLRKFIHSMSTIILQPTPEITHFLKNFYIGDITRSKVVSPEAKEEYRQFLSRLNIAI